MIINVIKDENILGNIYGLEYKNVMHNQYSDIHLIEDLVSINYYVNNSIWLIHIKFNNK